MVRGGKLSPAEEGFLLTKMLTLLEKVVPDDFSTLRKTNESELALVETPR